MINEIKTKINYAKEQAKQKQIVLLVSTAYNFIWAICKILLGTFTFSYFFCVSGASTLLFGFIKKIYLKNYDNNDFQEKIGKSVTIGILLIISSALFTFYMARLFFISETKNYGLILSISIATFSFTEFGLSIYNFIQAKKSNDILLQTFRCYSISSSSFAIVFTQVALLSTTNSTNNYLNGLTGIVAGIFSILFGIYTIIKAVKVKNKNLQID